MPTDQDRKFIEQLFDDELEVKILQLIDKDPSEIIDILLRGENND